MKVQKTYQEVASLLANTSQYLKNTDLKILPVNATHQAA